MDSLWLCAILFGTGVAAGFVDSIAGGGGLITLPVLMNLGLAPQDALGTNKLQACFGSGSATWHYGRAGLIRFKASLAGVAFTAIGAGLGTLLVRQLDPVFLNRAIPVLLAAIALYVLFRPKLGAEALRPRMEESLFHACFGLLIGFYDGFFGPGTGTFWAMAYMLGVGFDMTRATAHTKLMNFTSNVVSLLVFLEGGHVKYAAGLAMGLGQVAGARLGARVVIRNGARFIRPVFIVVVLAITVKLLYAAFVESDG